MFLSNSRAEQTEQRSNINSMPACLWAMVSFAGCVEFVIATAADTQPLNYFFLFFVFVFVLVAAAAPIIYEHTIYTYVCMYMSLHVLPTDASFEKGYFYRCRLIWNIIYFDLNT